MDTNYILRDLEKREKSHKHYREIAVGFTATVITLSILELTYLTRFLQSPNSVIYVATWNVTRLIYPLCTLFVLAILFCLLFQFFIFRGYYNEARGDQRKANLKYFAPADKIAEGILYLFLTGTSGMLFVLLGLYCFFAIVPFAFFAWYFYRWKF